MIFAIDFDGTIVEEKYPGIGPLIPGALEFLRLAKARGHTLILLTCRKGAYLREAIDFMASHGIVFDYINENAKELVAIWGDSRKIAADYYIDDHSLGKWTWDDAMKLLEPKEETQHNMGTLRVEQETPEIWGVWDDTGPYCVLADGKTLDEARRLLQETLDPDMEYCRIVPVHSHPVKRRVWDCDFEGPYPCKDPHCKHDHEEMVYEFRAEDI